ncbi:conserved hypothetical protein [Roseibium sp. TrichSKD4]|uniref:ABC transporter substrate-binding protein n=1 Tax=Roseibium sp. TrichSKD4 TaxID=744980 RepID=UPI0001E5674B|nr:ABC transporter substrate-binding protein [Roseibium sp. TrichSKD4]EFO33674.1 conserved hypothetical protein [Roseibium sp. TrichSKD4]
MRKSLPFLLMVAMLTTLGTASAEVKTTIGYLEKHVPPPPVLSNLDPIPEDDGLAGAKVGLADNATTGRFLKQTYDLTVQVSDNTDAFLNAARDMLQHTPYIVVNAPMDDLLKLADLPEAKDALLFNVGSADNRLRDEACRANLLHTLPSRSMLTDALAQFSVKKKWIVWVLLTGGHPGDLAYALSLENSARKFGIRILAKKIWEFDADMRRNAAQEVPLFTQNFGDHHLVVIADEPGDFGRYVAYNTWLPRPVAGTEGLVPSAWDRTVEQWGAAQLQSRFSEASERDMRPKDFAAWAAVRAIGEAVTRTNTSDVKIVRDYMFSEKFELAGFKGRPLTFRSWNGQLRQPIPITHPRALVAMAPMEGFLHERNEMDSLGIDQPESKCTAFEG